MCLTWLNCLCVWRDSVVHMCDVTRLCSWHETLWCGACPIHMCDMTHSCVWRDSFTRATWLMDRRKYPKITHTHTHAHTHVHPPNSPWHKTTQDNTTRARTNSPTHTHHAYIHPQNRPWRRTTWENYTYTHTRTHTHARTHTHTRARAHTHTVTPQMATNTNVH